MKRWCAFAYIARSAFAKARALREFAGAARAHGVAWHPAINLRTFGVATLCDVLIDVFPAPGATGALRRRALLLAALTNVFDDLCDEQPELLDAGKDVFFRLASPRSMPPPLRLFSWLSDSLRGSFTTDEWSSLQGYFRDVEHAQDASLRQRDSGISDEDVWQITRRKGEASAILAARVLGLEEAFNPTLRLLGTLAQLIDDCIDYREDMRCGVHSPLTRGIVGERDMPRLAGEILERCGPAGVSEPGLRLLDALLSTAVDLALRKLAAQRAPTGRGLIREEWLFFVLAPTSLSAGYSPFLPWADVLESVPCHFLDYGSSGSNSALEAERSLEEPAAKATGR